MNYKLFTGNIVWFTVVSGLFGWATTLFYGPYYSQVGLVRMALTTGMLFGFLLYLLRLYIRRFRLVVGGLILGLIFSGGIYVLPKGNWQKLETTPQPAAELINNYPVDLVFATLYIRARSGQFFLYDCQLMSDACTWDTVDHPLEPVPSSSVNCGRFDNEDIREATPIYPGNVVQRVTFTFCGGEVSPQSNFILLDDGSIWCWKRFDSVYDFIFSTVRVSLAGLVAGGLGVFLPFSGTRRGDT